MDIAAAVAEVLAREAEANRQMMGADHMAIIADVSRKFGIDVDVLSEAACDAAFARPS